MRLPLRLTLQMLWMLLTSLRVVDVADLSMLPKEMHQTPAG
jgi:hypothetical protein